MDYLAERVKMLQQEDIFLGGQPHLFEIAGRKQLVTLLALGLNPRSTVLDIGCGCLRGGYWLIHFLDPQKYFGIEPNQEMLDAGIRILLEPGLAEEKQPRFDTNADFDFSVFGEKFDFFVARSIWTHASKSQIKTMLDGFVNWSSEGAYFVTSYVKSTFLRREYLGDDWVGKSHESDTSKIVRYSFRWIQKECAARGLVVEEMKESTYNFSNQTWLKICADIK